MKEMILEPYDSEKLAKLSIKGNTYIHYLESKLAVKIHIRENKVQINGNPKKIALVEKILPQLYHSPSITFPVIDQCIDMTQGQPFSNASSSKDYVMHLPNRRIKPRGENQLAYLNQMKAHDITFGIGPSGTGKTYLAVVAAVHAWQLEKISRIVLVRPMVEAGEKIGFLPGDIIEKVDPFLRPLYDALFDLLGSEKTMKLIKKNVIEIAPLAFMRGRTLNEAFIILDEAQNVTPEQMKMFLTRLGFSSKAVINGDPTQVDLPKDQKSGLQHAVQLLKGIDAIAVTSFDTHDVVRHPLVQQVIKAYDKDG